MKQHFKMAALSLAVISSTSAFAQDSSEPAYKNWIGLSGMYYNTDDSRPLALTEGGVYDDGQGITGEYGFRFTQSWAARIEITKLDLDYGSNQEADGEMVGVDALYFLPNDVWYLFGGVKRQAVGESTTLGNIGIGKHWDIHESVKLVTEIATYHDFGEDYNDFSVKVGLAIPFGKSTPSAPRDSDNDGVVDGKDQCPMTPAGVRVDATGCSIDDDNDGVLNSVDQCPNTPAGTRVDATGCAIKVKDSDNDGVEDSKDMCPDTPAGVKVDAKGCTVFDEETVEITLRVLFDNESAVVKMPRDPEISEFAEFMKQYPSTTAVIEGHTSAPGTEAYNMDLSKRRAANFKEVMVDMYGIDGSRLETIGYGESQLLDPAQNAEAHRVNRRISVTVRDTVKVAEEK
ncbi:OmpA family protein [Alteromonas gracilis]|uniref:OmpA family protein n=1 Tax=Alteromonas gracilis TaxID=1479524 RepID=UPI003735503F